MDSVGSGRDNSRNPAERTHARGAVLQEGRTRVWGPPVGLRRPLGRVAGTAEHRAVGDVEGRTAGGERDDVIDGQVGGSVGGTLIARAPVPVQASPGAEDAGAEAMPGPGVVQGVVAAAVRLARVLATTATRAAGDDTTDRAQLHQQGAWSMRFPPTIRLRCYTPGTKVRQPITLTGRRPAD